MKTIKLSTKNMLGIFLALIMIFYFVIVLNAGEPVPGAEIYVELEPDDEPIACCPGGTDPSGGYMLALPKPLITKIAQRSNPTNKTQPYKLNFYYRVNASTLKKMISTMRVSEKQPISVTFKYAINYGAKKKTGKFSYSFNNVSEIKDELIKKQGPFTIVLDNPDTKEINTSVENDDISIGSKTGKNPL